MPANPGTAPGAVRVNKSAVLSADGLYRYRLVREWDEAYPPLAWVMLNPSTADASVDDPTIKKCAKFARSWGYGSILVANLFAWRATDPNELRMTQDPIGPDNDLWIKRIADEALDVVCAWGTKSPIPQRAPYVLQKLKREGHTLKALRITANGHPGHPLYIPDRTPMMSFA